MNELLELQKKRSIIIDCRIYNEYLNNHIEGSINMTLQTKIELWIGMLYSASDSSFVFITPVGKEQETL